MNKQAGLWIDHRKAFVVFIGAGSDQMEETSSIESGMEKHARFSGHASAEDGSADDQHDRQFAVHLAKYYDEVIARIGDAKAILIFGPGEAKGEFRKRLESKGLGERIVGVETTDKMSDNQVAAKVRQHYKM